MSEMAHRFLFLLVLLLSSLVTAMSQTRDQFVSRYGEPMGNVFQIKPGIAAELHFLVNGRLKEFRVFSTNSKNPALLSDNAYSVVRELLPKQFCIRPSIEHTYIESACPPQKVCKGYKEVFSNFTSVVVRYNKTDIAYVLVTLNWDLVNKPPPGRMSLLSGYEHEPHCGIDTAVGQIKKLGGIVINYDIGMLAGNVAERYAHSLAVEWTKVEDVNGNSVLIVLTNDKVIYATFKQDDANFYAKVGSQSDIDDFLKMVRTYHPYK